MLDIRYFSLVGLLCLSLLGSGCWYYSFTGASIPSHIETIAIPLFEDQSRSGQPNLSDDLTENLIDRFVRQTRLTLAPDEAIAHAVLSGHVTSYRNTPVSVSGQERAALNRVTITVSIRYQDQVNQEEVIEGRSFSAFAEYDPLEGLDGEAGAVTTALEQLAEDIFNEATSDWK